MNSMIEKELEQVRKLNGGILRPNEVVDFASDPSTALHKKFEWDDTEAAKEYRLHQARSVIRTVVKYYAEDKVPIRAYVSLVPDRSEGDSYRSLDDIMADPEHRMRFLDQAMREAESWRRRYEHFVELAPVVEAIDETTKKRKSRRG